MDQISKREVHGGEPPRHALKVAPLLPQHVLLVREIAKESFEVVWKEDEFLYFINNQDGLCKGLFWEETLIAYFLGLRLQDDLDIVSIATAKRFRRAGMAQLLLQSILGEVKGQAFLEVDIRNMAAREFYKKMGFKEGRIRKNYYQGKYDGICMAWR